MCTVTLIARQHGYVLGMNRDEAVTRPLGLPPKRQVQNGCAVLCPSEPSGGTWIATNETGVTMALINWYSIETRVTERMVSRGRVVNAVSDVHSTEAAHALLLKLPLERINPFRLIGVFPFTQEVMEWRWNLTHLELRKHEWKAHQWASSGFDEPQAQRSRGGTFRAACSRHEAGTSRWLRTLHRSHNPECGPFSTCMHREDAMTVSYTEVSVSASEIKMRYHDGCPCTQRGLSRASLKRSLQRCKDAAGRAPSSPLIRTPSP